MTDQKAQQVGGIGIGIGIIDADELLGGLAKRRRERQEATERFMKAEAEAQKLLPGDDWIEGVTGDVLDLARILREHGECCIGGHTPHPDDAGVAMLKRIADWKVQWRAAFKAYAEKSPKPLTFNHAAIGSDQVFKHAYLLRSASRDDETKQSLAVLLALGMSTLCEFMLELDEETRDAHAGELAKKYFDALKASDHNPGKDPADAKEGTTEGSPAG
jgi:hypothetical protein